MTQDPGIKGTRLAAGPIAPKEWKPYTYRADEPPGAILTRAGTSSHGAWCETCQDGVRNTTKRRAVDWQHNHNNRNHRADKGPFFMPKEGHNEA